VRVLYLIATPIGNLGDITLRALETLRGADLIAAEDTRHSQILLRHHGITGKPLVSFHEHNEAQRTAEFVERMKSGASLAVITDAGLPGISDPGARLVRACQRENLPFTIVPGPSAPLLALVGSGFDLEAGWFFGGFLPNKSGGREREIRRALDRDIVSVVFESPHRLQRTLDLIASLEPAREICVARELTKKFEEYRRGPAGEVAVHYQAHPAKGEIVLVISGGGAGNSKLEIRNSKEV
jgi:16S rRNA (cytidine1402-2'-O)-methyltransferase